MGAENLVICRDCKYTAWLEDYELVEFIQAHGQHKVAIFTSTSFEDLGSFEMVLRTFMGWPVEAEGQ
ncbi:unnamed protein product [marine sediment metagenome]|uniref:Uncharacterized protein n=1 Tax=marine sediment metagenome TaxID=412755 RepID=X1R3J2_9ZZZZ